LAVEIQIEGVNGILVSSALIHTLNALWSGRSHERGAREQGRDRISHSEGGCLIVDEVLLGEHCCKGGEIELLKVTLSMKNAL